MVIIMCGVWVVWITTSFFKDTSINTDGIAMRNVPADSATWTISIKNETDNIKDIYEKRKADRAAVKEFLKNRGLIEAISTEDFEIRDVLESGILTQPNTQAFKRYIEARKRYIVTDIICLKSEDVGSIGKASSDISLDPAMLDIHVESDVKYARQDLSKILVELTEEAGRDARLKADKMAAAAGCRVRRVEGIRTNDISIVADTEQNLKGQDLKTDDKSNIKRILVRVSATFRKARTHTVVK
jgi:hypothetical protein